MPFRAGQIGGMRGPFTRTIALGNFTQNSTVKTPTGPVGIRCRLVGGWLSFATLPAGGALTHRVVLFDASANAEVNLTTAIDAETGTAREGKALVLDTTNPLVIEADDTIESHQIADNVVVGTQQVGGFATLVFEPVEDL